MNSAWDAIRKQTGWGRTAMVCSTCGYSHGRIKSNWLNSLWITMEMIFKKWERRSAMAAAVWILMLAAMVRANAEVGECKTCPKVSLEYQTNNTAAINAKLLNLYNGAVLASATIVKTNCNQTGSEWQ